MPDAVLATDASHSLGFGTRHIGPVAFTVTDQAGAISRIRNAVATRSTEIFAFCNMHTFNLASRSAKLASALSRATVFNDGVGIDVASLILFGAKFPANLNGTDLTSLLLGSLDRPTRVYLLGAKPGVAERAGRELTGRFRLISIAGCHHGFFSDEDSDGLADQIRASLADIVLVGMGNPHQELWAAEMADRTGAVILCVGAYLDFVSGRVSRAPKVIRVIRCEWVYRMVREPVRLTNRYLGGLIPFLRVILSESARVRASKHADASSCKQYGAPLITASSERGTTLTTQIFPQTTLQ